MSAMRLFVLLSLPFLRKRPWRVLMTVLGVALGVGAYLGLHAASRAVEAGLLETVDRVAGKTQLAVWAGDAGLREEVLDRIQANGSVRLATPVVEAVVSSRMAAEGGLYLLGLDLAGDRSLREYELEAENSEELIDDPLVFLAQPESVLLTRRWAEARGLGVGGSVELETVSGPRLFRIRGLMRGGGLGGVFGGNLVVMDVYAAQKMLGRGRRFDRIDILLQPGVELERARTELQILLGPAFVVGLPSMRGQQYRSLLEMYSSSSALMSGFALLLSACLIYNVFSVAVEERRKEIAVLRMLGAVRSQVRRLFLLESLAIGGVGSVGGVVAGVGLGRLVGWLTGDVLGRLYGLPFRASENLLEGGLMVQAGLAGLAVSMAAAWLPARRIAHLEPVQALQKGRAQRVDVVALGRHGAVAVGLAVMGWLWIQGAKRPVELSGAMVMVVGSLVAAVAPLTVIAVRGLRPWLLARSSVEALLAADSLLSAPRRAAIAISAMSLAVSLTVTVAGVTGATHAALIEWTDQSMNADLFLTPAESLVRRDYRLPAGVVEEAAQLGGVREAVPVRWVRLDQPGAAHGIVATDLMAFARNAAGRVVAGDLAAAVREAEAGRAVIVSDSFASLRRLRLGDAMRLASPMGIQYLPIAAIVRDFSDTRGVVLLERELYRRLWGDDSVSYVSLYLRPGVSRQAVRQEAERRFAGRYRAFVLDPEPVRGTITEMGRRWYVLTYVQVLVAMLVALLGIASALTLSITGRRQELGVFRAVGATMGQVRGALRWEALLLAVTGVGIGLLAGAAHLGFSLVAARNAISGHSLEYLYPMGVAGVMASLLPPFAVLASSLPARAALRNSVVEALEYE